jgi:hypothetical protein
MLNHRLFGAGPTVPDSTNSEAIVVWWMSSLPWLFNSRIFIHE